MAEPGPGPEHVDFDLNLNVDLKAHVLSASGDFHLWFSPREGSFTGKRSPLQLGSVFQNEKFIYILSQQSFF